VAWHGRGLRKRNKLLLYRNYQVYCDGHFVTMINGMLVIWNGGIAFIVGIAAQRSSVPKV
jgi:hypothetical protein